MANNSNYSTTNVSGLVSPDILSNVKKSSNISSFGDQLPNIAAKGILSAASQSTLAKLYTEKAGLIKEGIASEINYNKRLIELEIRNTPTKKIENGKTVEVPAELSDEEYSRLVAITKLNYQEFQDNIQKRKEDNQKAIDNYLKDPFAKQKEKIKKRKEAIKKAKSRNKAEKRKARQQKRKAVLKSATKSLIPVLTLLLTDKISEIIAQNDTIKKLVNDTNKIITEANESGNQAKLDTAKAARDSALRVIQNNEDKITKINNQLKNIAIYISIFNTIVNIIAPPLLTVPTPSPAPDVVTSPKETFRRKVYEPALKVLNTLTALLPTIIVSLEKAIQILQDYKAQLLNINNTIDNLTTPLLINTGTNAGNDESYSTYKGFKFAIRQEIGPRALVVANNKRHYAVAIDTNDVEVLKSEPSFTLDPNDLIEQLKLIIDRENLIG